MGKLLTPRNIAWTLGILAVMVLSAVLFPVPLPTISLPAEKVIEVGKPGGFFLSNTLITTFLADIVLVALAIAGTRSLKLIPSGLQNVLEWIIEGFYNLVDDVAGRENAKRWFPLIMTIMLFVLVANWWELVPGVDSIGLLTHPHEEGMTAYKARQLGPIGLLTRHEVKDPHEGYVLVPFMRTATTDLNLPLALALISVFWTQVQGFRALGLGYLKRFFNFSGFLEAIVGFLELVSELAKIISFSFRLFGNIFAGTILLFVIPYLIPFFVPLPFYGLEVFVGFMQAFVFAMLTLVFMTIAVVGHGHEH